MNLELQNIYVHFSHKSVLKGINILFKEGQIHGLLGENGAGKSTTANIISGELTDYQGKLLLDGKETVLANSKAAIKNGICYVHQTPMLAKEISIKENLVLGLKNVDKEKILELSGIWLKDIPLSTLVKNVGSDTRFFVALTGALLKNPKFLILDEPSALLDDSQRDFLFTNMQRLAKDGMNILLITHNLQEALKYCDTINVLEDGHIVESEDYLKKMEMINQSELAALESIQKQTAIRVTSDDEPPSSTLSLEVKNVTSRPSDKPALFNINFYIRQKEIVLIQGLPEDGTGTLEDLLTGFQPHHTQGEIIISELQEQVKQDKQQVRYDKQPAPRDNQQVSHNKLQISHNKQQVPHNELQQTPLFTINLKNKKLTAKILRHSILLKNGKPLKTGIIPTNRKSRGAAAEITINDMLLTGHKKAATTNNKIIRLKKVSTKVTEKSTVQSIIQAAKVNITPNEKVKNLSGGMLQRLILNRELFANPELLILCHPLQGLDFKSSNETCDIIEKAASKGAMVLVISSNGYLRKIATRTYRLSSGHLELEEPTCKQTSTNISTETNQSSSMEVCEHTSVVTDNSLSATSMEAYKHTIPNSSDISAINSSLEASL